MTARRSAAPSASGILQKLANYFEGSSLADLELAPSTRKYPPRLAAACKKMLPRGLFQQVLGRASSYRHAQRLCEVFVTALSNLKLRVAPLECMHCLYLLHCLLTDSEHCGPALLTLKPLLLQFCQLNDSLKPATCLYVHLFSSLCSARLALALLSLPDSAPDALELLQACAPALPGF